MKLALMAMLCSIASLAAGTEAKVKLPGSRADLVHGQKLFEVHCARCHGAKGEGGRGPVLAKARLTRAPNDAALDSGCHQAGLAAAPIELLSQQPE